MIKLMVLLKLLKKIPPKGWAIIVVALAIGGYILSLHGQIKELSSALVADTAMITINDSLSAKVAGLRLQKDELSSSLAIAKKLNAELVAAAKVSLIPDTIVRESVRVVEIPTTNDSIRLAIVNDTTWAGVLEGKIVVFPRPTPIKFDYSLSLFPIDFEVSLLRVTGNRAVFGVKYSWGETQIHTTYAKLPKQPDRFYSHASIGYLFATNADEPALAGQLGVNWNPFWKIQFVGNAQLDFVHSEINTYLGLGVRF
jgi:hypothetical protein